jgi:2-dehydropantoate 2-reductase
VTNAQNKLRDSPDFNTFEKKRKLMRIAIIGSGGVGGYIGAKLWNSGNDVVFIARGAHLAAMQQNGLQLESPDGDIDARATFTAVPAPDTQFDLVVIGVKSHDTEAAARLALPVLKNDAIVMTIQNGIENEEILSNILGKEHIIPAAAYIISTIASPGVIRHEGGTGKFKFGEPDGTISTRCKMLEQTFAQAGIVGEAVENIRKALWWKFIFICGQGGMTAYTRSPIGKILEDYKLKAMLWGVVHEAAGVGKAQGIDSFTDVEEKVLAHCARLPATTTSSMYYDLSHGKKVEVEALNGAVVRLGKKFSVPTPANKKIYSALKPFA